MSIQVGFEIDVAGFKRGIEQVKSASATIASTVGNVMKGAAAGFAAASAAVVVASKHMFDAMSKGGELVDLSEQTGLAVDKLMELQVAFEQAGLGADEVGSVVNKMQRSIADAANGSASGQAMFANLGISLQSLGQMDAAGQLEEVGNKIMAIQDPAQRSAAAMEIFGKSGGRMLALFASGGLSGAQEALGGQARLMAQNAAYFDEITDKLGTAALKVQGFFVGLASAIVPDLMAAADAINGIDFSQLGVQIGDGIAVLVELIKSNVIGDAFLIGMQIAILKVAQYISTTLTKAVLAASVPFLMLAEGEFWSGMISTLLGGFQKLVSYLSLGVSKAMMAIGEGLSQIPGLKGTGESITSAFSESAKTAEADLLKAQANIDNGMLDLGQALSTAADKILPIIDNLDLSPMQDSIDTLAKDLSGMVATANKQITQNKEGLKKPETKAAPSGFNVVPPSVQARSFEAITSSLGRLGGGITRGANITVMPMVDEQKITNKFLQEQNKTLIGVREDLFKQAKTGQQAKFQ